MNSFGGLEPIRRFGVCRSKRQAEPSRTSSAVALVDDCRRDERKKPWRTSPRQLPTTVNPSISRRRRRLRRLPTSRGASVAVQHGHRPRLHHTTTRALPTSRSSPRPRRISSTHHPFLLEAIRPTHMLDNQREVEVQAAPRPRIAGIGMTKS